MRRLCLCLAALVVLALGAAPRASAAFHIMQIEQIIGGVNGDVTAQAIQLRMRSSGQNIVSNTRLVSYDSAGLNPILLINMTTNVAISTAGSRILIATMPFVSQTSPACVPDFIMTTPIPADRLAAGRLAFQDDSGIVYWAVAWGAGYTGTNTGALTNDPDGNFNPQVAAALPSGALNSLLFPGTHTAASTNNLADYMVTAGAATVRNNAASSFVVSGLPVGSCCVAEACTSTTQTNCTNNLGGIFTPAGVCDPNPCEPPAGPGACCDGTNCTITLELDCPNSAANWKGEGSVCETEPGNEVACCRANFDGLNGVGVPDIFAFLAAWFAQDDTADIDETPGVGVPDIFAFLALWFAGC